MSKNTISKIEPQDLGDALIKVLSAASEMAATRLKEDLATKISGLMSRVKGFKIVSTVLFIFLSVMEGYFALHQCAFILIGLVIPSVSDSYRDFLANISIFVCCLVLASLSIRSLAKDLSRFPTKSPFEDKVVLN
jgi:hypothetical protein